VSEALAHQGRALIDLATDPYTPSIQPHITAAQVKGFALAAGKTVLDGGLGKDARAGSYQRAQHPSTDDREVEQ